MLQSTVLREVWGKLYHQALQASTGADDKTPTSSLNRRILSSVKPDHDGMMVFVLDLTNPGG